MGKRGPQKTPTAVLQSRGSWRAKGRAEAEPEIEPSRPDCPAWVCDEAREHWKPIADMLYGMGVMADAFAPALGLLVNALGRYIDLERQLDEHGYVSTTDKGNRIAEPIWSARNKAWEQVLKALREFGMTPASLSAVTRGQADKEDGDDDDVRGSILQKIG